MIVADRAMASSIVGPALVAAIEAGEARASFLPT